MPAGEAVNVGRGRVDQPIAEIEGCVRAVSIDLAARSQRRPIAVPGFQCREDVDLGEIPQSMRALHADCIFEIDELSAGLALE